MPKQISVPYFGRNKMLLLFTGTHRRTTAQSKKPMDRLPVPRMFEGDWKHQQSLNNSPFLLA
jgi:hypothetical protein